MAKADKVSHPYFMGAHRYTTGGGIWRPAGGIIRLTRMTACYAVRDRVLRSDRKGGDIWLLKI